MNNLWWRTSLPLWKRLYYMWKYRGQRMGNAMNDMYDNAVRRAQDGRS